MKGVESTGLQTYVYTISLLLDVFSRFFAELRKLGKTGARSELERLLAVRIIGLQVRALPGACSGSSTYVSYARNVKSGLPLVCHFYGPKTGTLDIPVVSGSFLFMLPVQVNLAENRERRWALMKI